LFGSDSIGSGSYEKKCKSAMKLHVGKLIWMNENGDNQGRKRRKVLVGETSMTATIWGHAMS
jgi:hypothetical protein